MIRLTGILVGLAVFVTACGGGAASNSGSGTKTEIKVGVAGSFSGATAFYGQESQKGTQLAIDEINAKSSKFKFTLVTADDGCNPQGGAQAFSNLADVQNVDVILGSPCSPATLSAMAVLPRSKTPALTQGATNPAISQQAGTGGNPYMWRMNLDDSIMATTFSKYIADQGIKTVGTLAVNNDFGRGAVNSYKPELSKNSIKVVAEEYYVQGSGEFRAQLTKIGAAKPDAMLVIGASQDAAVWAKQMKELGLTFKVFTRGDVVSTTFQEAAKDPCLGNGIQEGTNWDGSNTLVGAFYKAFKAKFGTNPLLYAGESYVAMYVIEQAANLGGPGRDGIQKGFAKVDYNSPIGRIKFDSHNQAHGNMFIEGYVNCEIKLLKTITQTT